MPPESRMGVSVSHASGDFFCRVRGAAVYYAYFGIGKAAARGAYDVFYIVFVVAGKEGYFLWMKLAEYQLLYHGHKAKNGKNR